jgi:hypothetical protein
VHVLVGVAGALRIFLLPRRVKRDPRLVHAIADLAFAFRTRTAPAEGDRLSPDALTELCERVEEAGLELTENPELRAQLKELRESYEPYARALSRRLALPLPDWLPPEELETNWQRASAQRRGRSLLR